MDDKVLKKIPIIYDFAMLEGICFKKCVNRLNKMKFTPGEMNCLDHCYSKGLHSVSHGLLCLGYLEKQVEEFQATAKDKLKKKKQFLDVFTFLKKKEDE